MIVAGRGYDYREPGYESDDSADYRPREEEEVEDPMPSFEDVKQDLQSLQNAGADSPEVLERILKLLEKQRLETQKALTRMEEQEYSKDTCNNLLQAILASQSEQALQTLERSNPTTVMQFVDSNGMHAVHHAAKLGLVAVVEKILEINPAAADKVTRADGRPANWTPMMVLSDNWTGSDEQCQALRLLLWVSQPSSVSVRTLSGNTCLHLVCSQGNTYFAKRICYGLQLACRKR